MHRLVHDLSSNKHFVKVHLERLAETCDPHHCPICLSVDLVSDLDGSVIRLSITEESGACVTEWPQETFVGCLVYGVPTFDLPTVRSSAQLVCHLENSSFSRTHHQRPVAIVHSSRIPRCISHPLQTGYLFVPCATYIGSYDGVLYGLFDQLLGDRCLPGGGHCLCDPEYLLEEAIH